MSWQSHLRRAYSWALLAVIFFVIITLLVLYEGITGFDLNIISVVQGWETPNFTSIMEGFSWLGSTIVVTILAIVNLLFLAFVLNHRKELLLFIAAVGGAALLNSALKYIFQRARPDIHRLVEEAGYSFPSGHSMAAFALYGVLTYLLWRHVTSGAGRAILIVIGSFLVLSIGMSRIYLGVHYPSDVIGGYLASGVWLGLLIELFQRWAKPSV